MFYCIIRAFHQLIGVIMKLKDALKNVLVQLRDELTYHTRTQRQFVHDEATALYNRLEKLRGLKALKDQRMELDDVLSFHEKNLNSHERDRQMLQTELKDADDNFEFLTTQGWFRERETLHVKLLDFYKMEKLRTMYEFYKQLKAFQTIENPTNFDEIAELEKKIVCFQEEENCNNPAWQGLKYPTRSNEDLQYLRFEVLLLEAIHHEVSQVDHPLGDMDVDEVAPKDTADLLCIPGLVSEKTYETVYRQFMPKDKGNRMFKPVLDVQIPSFRVFNAKMQTYWDEKQLKSATSRNVSVSSDRSATLYSPQSMRSSSVVSPLPYRHTVSPSAPVDPLTQRAMI
jgi:hypothetical protein